MGFHICYAKAANKDMTWVFIYAMPRLPIKTMKKLVYHFVTIILHRHFLEWITVYYLYIFSDTDTNLSEKLHLLLMTHFVSFWLITGI